MISFNNMSITTNRGDSMNVTFELDDITILAGDKIVWTLKHNKSDTTPLITKEITLEAEAKDFFIGLTKEEMTMDSGYYYYDVALLTGSERISLGTGSIILKEVIHNV